MAFSLMTTTVCLLGVSYLYWMLLGAWRASRRTINQPWSALNVIQPNKRGLPSATSDDLLRQPGSNSLENDAISVQNQPQRLGDPEEREHEWSQGLRTPGVERKYRQEGNTYTCTNHNGYHQPREFLKPAFQQRETKPPPQPNDIPIPRRRNHLSHFHDDKDSQEGHRFPTSLPQNLGDGFLGPSRSYMEDRDSDGDVNMLMNRRRRFH